MHPDGIEMQPSLELYTFQLLWYLAEKVMHGLAVLGVFLNGLARVSAESTEVGRQD